MKLTDDNLVATSREIPTEYPLHPSPSMYFGGLYGLYCVRSVPV